jgi:hypothetical protein
LQLIDHLFPRLCHSHLIEQKVDFFAALGDFVMEEAQEVWSLILLASESLMLRRDEFWKELWELFRSEM